jgi:putative hydrolase of the HAD superfamily
VGRVLFDFDGTLGHRPGGWSQCLIDVLDELWPGHGLAAQDVRPPMGDGFPWHHPERAHVDQSADEWWEYLRPVIDGAYARAGVPDAVARRAGAGSARSTAIPADSVSCPAPCAP